MEGIVLLNPGAPPRPVGNKPGGRVEELFIEGPSTDSPGASCESFAGEGTLAKDAAKGGIAALFAGTDGVMLGGTKALAVARISP